MQRLVKFLCMHADLQLLIHSCKTFTTVTVPQQGVLALDSASYYACKHPSVIMRFLCTLPSGIVVGRLLSWLASTSLVPTYAQVNTLLVHLIG